MEDTYAFRSKYHRVLSVSLVLAMLLGYTPVPYVVFASAEDPVGTLHTIVQVVGGTAVPSDFQIVVSSGTSTQEIFTGNASGTTLSIPTGELYTVDTSHVSNYIPTWSPECFGAFINDADTVTCTITNTFSASAGATLHVVTRVKNIHGGTNVPEDFIVNISGGEANPAFFRGTTGGENVSLTPGANFAVMVNTGERYTSTLSSGCSGAVSDNDTVTCNVTLSDLVLFPGGTTSPSSLVNGQLEVVDSSDPTRPEGWVKGFDWGTNIATYTYPVSVGSSSDFSSGNAMRVSYAAYVGNVLTGGDAKWHHQAPTPVIPGHRYQYQDVYQADVDTFLVGEFFDASQGHLSHAGFYLIPKTEGGAWSIASESFIAPPGASYLKVYHQLNSTGALTLDNISLSEIALPAQFSQGFVSLAFDDGYNDHFSNAKTILDSAGVRGTFFIVSHNSGFAVANPALEFADGADPAKPLSWHASIDASSTYTYPVPGHTGHAVRVSSSDGIPDGGWNTAPTSLFANQNFRLSHYYKSDATSAVYVQVKKNDQSISYMQSDGGLVSSKVAYVTLPPSADWTQYSSPGFWIPPESAEISMRYSLVASGTLDIDDVNLGAYLDFMSPSELLSLEQAQHEIGGHTQTHVDLTSISLAQASKEVNDSRQELLSGGMSPVLSFAYPLGGNNVAVQNIVQSTGYTSARGTIEGFNGKNVNRYDLRSKMVMTNTSMSEIRHLINGAVADHTWLILTFHQITPIGASSTAYTTTPEKLASVVEYLTKNNISVSTVADGAALMDGGTGVVDTTPPVIASHEDIAAIATDSSGALVSYTTPTVADNVDVSITAICAPLSNTVFALGTTSVSCTAQDASGNVAIPTSFFVHVTLATGTPTTTPPVTPPTGGGGGGGGSAGGSASSIYWGCMDKSASNYNRLANHDFGCVFPVSDQEDVEDQTSVDETPTTTPSRVSPARGEVLGTGTVVRHRFQNPLWMGLRGEEVLELQKRLGESGHFSGPFTGYFGRLTYAAVKRFQADHQFEQVGSVGPKTRSALNESGNSWTIASTRSGIVMEKK